MLYNKNFNPQLYGAVIKGHGIRGGIKTPTIYIGSNNNEDLPHFQRGDLLDANATVDVIKDVAGDIPGKSTEFIPYNKRYFTIEAISDCTISWDPCVQYSTDGKTWTAFTSKADSITLERNTSMMFKGEQLSGYSYPKPVIDGLFNLSGNIMSIVRSDDFLGEGADSVGTFQFMNLFSGLQVVHAKDLILPATTLNLSCYEGMFYLCRYLLSAPELPSANAGYDCYRFMFADCTSLMTPPSKINPLSMGQFACEKMFKGCVSLTCCPKLPCVELNEQCYFGMFQECTSLVTPPELPATTLGIACYNWMFYKCTNLGIDLSRVVLLATEGVDGCYSNMFNGCKNLHNVEIHISGDVDQYTYHFLYDAGGDGVNKLYTPANTTITLPDNWTQVVRS